MLANLVSGRWNPQSSETPIFIDRDGQNFKYILEFYRDGEIIVPRTVAIEAIKKDALYFGLPEILNIKESNEQNLTVQDLSQLMMGFSNMKTTTKAANAALWATSKGLLWKRFLEEATSIAWKGFPIDVRMDEYIKKCPEYHLTNGLISEIKKTILSFEEDFLSPPSISTNETPSLKGFY
jgi:hypothetical protein